METSFILMIGLVVTGIVSFMFLLIFYPEWVGISGKSAQKTMKEHESGSQTDDSQWS